MRLIVIPNRSIDVPHATIVLAMSADGKIADFSRAPARFGSKVDQTHLEKQVAQADAVLFGAGTLRAYGTTLRVSQANLLQQRQQQGKPSQPVQIVCSRSAKLNPNDRFFSQPVPRWLLTTQAGAQFWQNRDEFEQILVTEAIATHDPAIDWLNAFGQLFDLGIRRLAVLGGGELVAALLAANLIDELWLTVCPLLLGGTQAPTPVDGVGFAATLAPRLQLLEVRPVEQEVFLHYRVKGKEAEN